VLASSSMFFSRSVCVLCGPEIPRGGRLGERADKQSNWPQVRGAGDPSREMFFIVVSLIFIFIRVFRAYWLKTSWLKACFFTRPRAKNDFVSPPPEPLWCATPHAGKLLTKFCAGGACWSAGDPHTGGQLITGVSATNTTLVLYGWIECVASSNDAQRRTARAGAGLSKSAQWLFGCWEEFGKAR